MEWKSFKKEECLFKTPQRELHTHTHTHTHVCVSGLVQGMWGGTRDVYTREGEGGGGCPQSTSNNMAAPKQPTCSPGIGYTSEPAVDRCHCLCSHRGTSLHPLCIDNNNGVGKKNLKTHFHGYALQSTRRASTQGI